MYGSGSNCKSNDKKNNCFNGRDFTGSKKFLLCLLCFVLNMYRAETHYLNSSHSRFIIIDSIFSNP